MAQWAAGTPYVTPINQSFVSTQTASLTIDVIGVKKNQRNKIKKKCQIWKNHSSNILKIKVTSLKFFSLRLRQNATPIKRKFRIHQLQRPNVSLVFRFFSFFFFCRVISVFIPLSLSLPLSLYPPPSSFSFASLSPAPQSMLGFTTGSVQKEDKGKKT